LVVLAIFLSQALLRMAFQIPGVVHENARRDRVYQFSAAFQMMEKFMSRRLLIRRVTINMTLSVLRRFVPKALYRCESKTGPLQCGTQSLLLEAP
jgi:hypothetical protein